jgi:hypothetical protein
MTTEENKPDGNRVVAMLEIIMQTLESLEKRVTQDNEHILQRQAQDKQIPIPPYYRLSDSTGTNCPHDISPSLEAYQKSTFTIQTYSGSLTPRKLKFEGVGCYKN